MFLVRQSTGVCHVVSNRPALASLQPWLNWISAVYTMFWGSRAEPANTFSHAEHTILLQRPTGPRAPWEERESLFRRLQISPLCCLKVSDSQPGWTDHLKAVSGSAFRGGTSFSTVPMCAVGPFRVLLAALRKCLENVIHHFVCKDCIQTLLAFCDSSSAMDHTAESQLTFQPPLSFCLLQPLQLSAFLIRMSCSLKLLFL